MSVQSAFPFWLQLFASLALEMTIIFILAFVLQRASPISAWRRTIWQVAMLAAGLTAVLEGTGVSRAAIGWSAVHFHQPERWSRTSPVRPEERPAPQSETRVVRTVISATGVEPVRHEGESSLSTHAVRQQQPRFTWWPGILWLAGCGLVIGRAGMARLMFAILRQTRESPASQALMEQVQCLAHLLKIRSRVRVTYLRKLTGPIAFGILRPSVGLPEGFEADFTPERRQAMLVHELAHLAARDPLWYLFTEAVTALLWWHPLAWWARRQLAISSECAADEASLLLQNGPDALAESLVMVAARLSQPKSLGWLGIEGNGFRSGLGRRVDRVLRLDRNDWRPMNRVVGWLMKAVGPAGLVLVAMAGVAWALPHVSGEDVKTVAESWQGSIGGLAFDALRSGKKDSEPPDVPLTSRGQFSRAAVPGLIQDAKLFLDMGKLDEAEALLDEVLKVQSANQTAIDYWNVI